MVYDSRGKVLMSAEAKRRQEKRGSHRSVSVAPTLEPRRDAGPIAVARPVIWINWSVVVPMAETIATTR